MQPLDRDEGKSVLVASAEQGDQSRLSLDAELLAAPRPSREAPATLVATEE
jgi:hypothetical protein